jgi:hypothetical protein
MHKRSLILFLIFCSLYVVVLAQQEESLIITTYYPSPYGSYIELTAHRMKIGQNYSGSGIGFLTDGLIVEGNVGIRTSSPRATVEINGTLRVEQGSRSGRAVCWRSDNTLGYCSSPVAGDGSCTCN